MVTGEFFVFLTVYLSFFSLVGFAEAAKVVQEEVDALEEIAKTMGSKYWKFNADSCQVEMVGVTELPPNNSEASIACSCNSTDCHVTKIVLKGYNLPGVLPPQLVKLPQLQEIDFALNYLHGTIPPEWATTQLTSISVLVNRLSGEIPKELGNITTLTYICLDANQFSGGLPPDLGKLIHLDTLMLSSNQLTGKLPQTLAGLTNLTNFRINDNNFNGTIPDFIQNWKKLTRLELHASGLEGPIPTSISLLNNLQELRISDIGGPSQPFPILSNATGLIRVVLRNCNLSGNLPVDLWKLQNLEMLDVSFNKLVGTIPATITAQRLRFVFLNGNSLSGDIPESIMKQGSNIDLSYNNFALQGPEQPACRENLNLNLNLFKSSSAANSTTTQTLPCMKTFSCPKYSNCLHVNSGGKDITVKENKTSFTYEGDGDVVGGAAKYFIKLQSYWGFSSTGDFMDDFDYQNTRYTVSVPESNIPSLYSTARISPISLTYFHYCLENGQYSVKLHFAELQFTNDNTYGSLGKRMFDVYVQGSLVWADLNVEDEAGGVQKPLVKELLNVNVTNHALEIRFYFAGKGTTRIPVRGVYGPIISGISVTSDSSPCSNGSKKNGTVGIIVGVVLAFCLISILLGILWWKGCFSKKRLRERDTEGFDFSMKGTFTLKEIRAATNDFDPANKIGEGGFGPVYKGVLQDSTVIAVKQLSSKSKQGNREFLNEMGVISCIQHPNLVKLHGCCVERDQLLLVYEYMENNSLARALFGYEHSQLKLDWPTRRKICLGIARGLAYLHEESRLKIVHRDIKATNVLLDGDLNPKISDFGLAKLDEEERSHISTRVAGTIGYMAPEYALWGYLTDKADVYSFGVLLLEIVTGKSNNNYMPNNKCVCLLDWACHLQQSGDLMELIDEKLQGEFKKKEAETLVKVALLCSNASATVRPTMTEVVCMLEGKMKVPDTIQESNSTEDLRFKAMRGLRQHEKNQSLSSGEAQSSTTLPTFSIDSASDRDFYNLNPPEPRT